MPLTWIIRTWKLAISFGIVEGKGRILWTVKCLSNSAPKASFSFVHEWTNFSFGPFVSRFFVMLVVAKCNACDSQVVVIKVEVLTSLHVSFASAKRRMFWSQNYGHNERCEDLHRCLDFGVLDSQNSLFIFWFPMTTRRTRMERGRGEETRPPVKPQAGRMSPGLFQLNWRGFSPGSCFVYGWSETDTGSGGERDAGPGTQVESWWNELFSGSLVSWGRLRSHCCWGHRRRVRGDILKWLDETCKWNRSKNSFLDCIEDMHRCGYLRDHIQC